MFGQVINRVWKIAGFGLKKGKKKLRVLCSGLHTPTQYFWLYLPSSPWGWSCDIFLNGIIFFFTYRFEHQNSQARNHLKDYKCKFLLTIQVVSYHVQGMNAPVEQLTRSFQERQDGGDCTHLIKTNFKVAYLAVHLGSPF